MLKKKMTQVVAVAFIAAGSAAIIVGCGDDAADDGPSPKDGPKTENPKGGEKNGPGPEAPKPPSGVGAPEGQPDGIEGKK